MRNKLLVPNCTSVPNVLLDHVIQRLSAGGLRVLLAIVRLTYGWQKQSEKISLSQLQTSTGLSRQGVVNGLRDLGNLVIIRPGKQGVGANEYELNLDISTGQLVKTVDQSVVNKVDQSKNLTSQKNHQQVVNEVDPSKERRTKESKRARSRQKTPPNPDVKTFIDWYCQEFTTRFSEPYNVSGGREGETVKQLLQTRNLSELQAKAVRFFDTDDEWIQQKVGYTIGVFASQINKLASTGRRSAGTSGRDFTAERRQG